jgi:hypothetical protein
MLLHTPTNTCVHGTLYRYGILLYSVGDAMYCQPTQYKSDGTPHSYTRAHTRTRIVYHNLTHNILIVGLLLVQSNTAQKDLLIITIVTYINCVLAIELT